MPEDSPPPPPGHVVWLTKDAPSGRTLTPEEARAQQAELLRALKRERNLTTDPNRRARLTVTIRSLTDLRPLRAVEDDETPDAP